VRAEPRARSAALAAVGLLLALAPAAAADPGRSLYEDGVSPSGAPVSARVGSGATRLPATVMPCAGCHGRDGLGRPEGGITPPTITWDDLTKPYGHQHADGRRHPPFTRASLGAAITAGVDPAGNPLDPSMPRYEMSAADLDLLIGHLERIGRQSAPGVAERTLTLGLLLPRRGPFAGTAVAAAVLRAALDDVNAGGGIYGRRLRIVTAESDEDVAAFGAAAARLLDEPVFALIGAVPAFAQAAVAERAEAARAPLINLLPPATEPGHDAYGFHVLAGRREEVSCLLQRARGRVALITPEASSADALPAYPAPADAAAARRLVDELGRLRIGALLVLDAGPGFALLLEAARTQGFTPDLLLPGSALRGAPPAGYPGLRLIAYPTLPIDWRPERRQALAALVRAARVPDTALLSQIMGYVAAQLVTEGLRRAGKDLARADFVGALEDLYRFDTGLTPPLSYGPNRRIGAKGAYLVALRPGDGAPSGRWCEAAD
jgi:ABC-type branched-subunit amino acid transport system substrate-binding protein